MQVRIKGYTFLLSEPHREGDVMLKAEAQALNGLRAENISNTLRKIVTEATAGLAPGELLPVETISELQERITKYDLGYRLQEQHTPRPRKGDIELAIAEVAEELVLSRFRQAGVEGLTPDDLAPHIAEASGLPAVIEEARARVAARRRVTSGSLDDL